MRSAGNKAEIHSVESKKQKTNKTQKQNVNIMSGRKRAPCVISDIIFVYRVNFSNTFSK